MHLGKDFWFIIKILKMIMRVLEEFGKTDNEDTPSGQV